MSEQEIILTEELTKIYGRGDVEVRALDGISLAIGEGEFVAIMGPSGSGKSTMMNILGCLDRPTSGKYFLAGEDVSQMDKNQLALIRNRRLGFIFQSYNLLQQLTAIENVMLPLLYTHNGDIPAAQQKEKAVQALSSVGLEQRMYHRPQELSGGQMQRVAIARALITDPVVILADEPTGNLDSHSGEEIMSLMKQLHIQGRTIVMVTHDDDIAAYADRVIRFKDGKIDRDIHNGHSRHRSAGHLAELAAEQPSQEVHHARQ